MTKLNPCTHESFIYYDGSLGYEANVCSECGNYFDNGGEHPVDEWSESYIKLKNTKKNIDIQIKI